MKRILSLHFLLVILFFTITVYGNVENESNREKYEVIIVGGGISGVAAATRLLSNNVSDIAILEASNRLGGRVYTAPFGDFLIEYGAQWVHGQGDNPVYKIAEPYNFLYVQNWDTPSFLKHSDSKINISVVSSWLFEESYGLFNNDNDMMLCNCSTEHYFNNKFNELIKNKNVDEYTAEAVADFTKKCKSADDAIRNLNEEGSWGSAQYLTRNGSLTVAWKTGYHSFINILTGKYEGKQLPVEQKTKFNKVVQTINWTGNEVEITCEDGSRYFADHVIVTVSLGVLKFSSKTMFNPPLPDNKLTAIESLGFGLLNKMYIQFETRWWPLDYEYLLCFLWTNEDIQKFKNESKYGGWTTEIPYIHFVENQPRLLEGWLTGDAAQLMETLSDDELTGAIIELFNWFLGDQYSISKPINVTRSAWASNPFVHGSYSFRSIKSDRLGYSAANVLAEPLLFNQTNPVILFAGEASSERSFSTVQGALETGWREATRILNFQL